MTDTDRRCYSLRDTVPLVRFTWLRDPLCREMMVQRENDSTRVRGKELRLVKLRIEERG